MRIVFFIILFVGYLLVSMALADDISDLKDQINKLTQTVDNLKSTVKAQQNKIDSQQGEIDLLKETHNIQQKAPVLASVSMNQPTPSGAATQEQIQAVNEKVDKVVEAQKKTLMSEFNPSIGLVGETIFSYRSQPSDKTGSDRIGGFDINQRTVELNLAASVDPFATGYAVITGSADASTGDTNIDVEEAAIQTTSLPWNLTLKAGRFFGEFGRLAYIHDHELPFVNRPIVLDQYIGGESQTDGLQLSWLLPVEHYVNLTLGLGDKFGDMQNNPGLFRRGWDLNYFGRLSTYFDLTPDWQAETGVSGLLEPRSDDRGGVLTQPGGSTLTEQGRRLVGADFSLRYIPLRDNQFRSFTWGNELLFSDNRYLDDPDAAPVNGDEFYKTVPSFGLYSYMTYKWDRQWSGGLLGEFVENQQNNSYRTFAQSVYLTYALSHWNQLRLQYTHTEHTGGSGLKDDDAIYLQWAWIIGSHSHGWQQR